MEDAAVERMKGKVDSGEAPEDTVAQPVMVVADVGSMGSESEEDLPEEDSRSPGRP